LENDPDWHPNPLLPETKGEIAVPIKLGDMVLGVLDVQSNVAGALGADDQLLLEGLCGQIAVAIESTRLRADMSERLEEINRLYRAMSHEGWQTYRQSADVSSGFIFDQAGLRSAEDVGLAEELFAAVPLTVPGGAVIGNLAVADDPHRPLSAEDEIFLQQVSEQVALALESARLFEQTQSALSTIQENEARLSEALNIAKLGHWEYDLERDRFTFNDQFYSIFRTTVEEVGSYELSSAEYTRRFVHPEDAPLVGKEIERGLASTDRHFTAKVEHRIIFPDGDLGYISVAINLERDENGKIIRWYGANQDITERKLAQEVITKHATELETVAQVSTTASTVLDPDQLLQSVVDLAKERFGLYHAHIYTFDQAWNTLLLAAGAGEVGRKLVAEEHAIPLSLEQSLVARAARERKPIIVNDVNSEPGFLPNPLLPETRAEMAVPMTVGDTLLGVFDVQSNNATGFSNEDAAIYVTLAAQVAVALQNARSYVEQAALVTQLRELDRLKSSFLANMSHELRTPLNSILGFADVIIEELDGPLTENMTNDLRLIQKNGQHLLHLINDVLDMAKIEAGRMNLNPEKFTAFEVIEEVTSITSTLASEKNLALFTEEGSDQNVKIFADRTRLRQVMINLVNNAIKFTENGKISLNIASLPGARILITVKDTGIGIPPDKLDAIFQEFTQVDSSSTRKAGGTGLGLPISRKLVEMHGGRLWAESTGKPGEGSTFFVELLVEARITETIEKQAK
jgi:signal transduction histidine kinase/PAS domain-containing protein